MRHKHEVAGSSPAVPTKKNRRQKPAVFLIKRDCGHEPNEGAQVRILRGFSRSVKCDSEATEGSEGADAVCDVPTQNVEKCRFPGLPVSLHFYVSPLLATW